MWFLLPCMYAYIITSYFWYHDRTWSWSNVHCFGYVRLKVTWNPIATIVTSKRQTFSFETRIRITGLYRSRWGFTEDKISSLSLSFFLLFASGLQDTREFLFCNIHREVTFASLLKGKLNYVYMWKFTNYKVLYCNVMLT